MKYYSFVHDIFIRGISKKLRAKAIAQLLFALIFQSVLCIFFVSVYRFLSWLHILLVNVNKNCLTNLIILHYNNIFLRNLDGSL